MKKLFDYLPVIIFFGLYYSTGRDIILATWGILLASTAQVALGWILWRKVDRLHWIVFGFTLVFGGLTIALNNDMFIKWRPTVINFTFAAILLGGQLLRDRNLLQRMCESLMISGLGYILPLTRRDWLTLNLSISLYFVFIGLLNLYVIYNFSTDFWVNFKLIGFTALNFMFYIGLFIYVYKRLPEDERKRLFGEQKDTPATDDQDKEKQKDALRDHQ